MINLYEILGVKRKASKAKIKKYYRKLSKIYHPDKKGGDADKFDMISKAYKILMDDEKRARYDFGENVDSILRSKENNKKDNQERIIISSILIKLMETLNPETNDIIEAIDKSIDLNISNSNKEIVRFNKEIKKYETFLKKLKCKNKKNKLMEQLALGQIENQTMQMQAFQKKNVNLEKAKKLIADFGYDICEGVAGNMAGATIIFSMSGTG